MNLTPDRPEHDPSSNQYKPIRRAIAVLEALFEGDFSAKTEKELRLATGLAGTSLWRILQTLEALGWVVQIHESGTKAAHWRVSTKLARIAWAYERDAFRRVQQIEQEYQNVTGKELHA